MPIIERPELASAKAHELNEKISPNMIGHPEDFSDYAPKPVPIYFYNVAPQEFNVPRYPNHPHMLIRACPKGQRYIMARGSISHPFQEFREDQNGIKTPFPTNGYREASKILNPDNPGTDQNYDVAGFNEGGNLNNYGVFWSLHNPPLDEEIEAAHERLKKTYRAELELLVAIESKEGPDGARGRANYVSHAAADYFGQSYSWHRSDLVPKDVNAAKVDCQSCGEKISPKARMCQFCKAPTDPELLDKWLAAQFEVKRGPGRPPAA